MFIQRTHLRRLLSGGGGMPQSPSLKVCPLGLFTNTFVSYKYLAVLSKYSCYSVISISKGKEYKQQLHTLPIDNAGSENVNYILKYISIKKKKRRSGDKLKKISLLQIILIQSRGLFYVACVTVLSPAFIYHLSVDVKFFFSKKVPPGLFKDLIQYRACQVIL